MYKKKHKVSDLWWNPLEQLHVYKHTTNNYGVPFENEAKRTKKKASLTRELLQTDPTISRKVRMYVPNVAARIAPVLTPHM